ncbi:TRAP transporter small permease [Alcaligenaceae bacterium]|nr:TRAP transporter small permease [Alcaligenaceae bacterium]
MTRVIRSIDKFTAYLGILSGFTVFLIMVVVCADVVGRSFFNKPLLGATELSELLLASLIFFGLAAAQQARHHYIVELVVVRLSPRPQSLLAGLTHLLSAGVVAMLAWYSTGQAFTSYEMGEISFGTVEFPIWPARAVVAFGLILFSLQYLIQFMRMCGLDGSSASETTEQ